MALVLLVDGQPSKHHRRDYARHVPPHSARYILPKDTAHGEGVKACHDAGPYWTRHIRAARTNLDVVEGTIAQPIIQDGFA
jgi:hypothetical protein